MSSYAIVGSGGLGGFYGARLGGAGHDVHFLVREDATAIRKQGWILKSVWGDVTLNSPNVYNSTAQMPQCDFVIVALKSTQNHLLKSLLPPLLGPHSVAIVLQNGLHVEEATEDVMGQGRVVGGCCFLCSNKRGPGHIEHMDYGRIELGAYRGHDDNHKSVSQSTLQHIVDDFRSAKVPIEIAPSLSTARWRKLMWNIPFNGLSVVLDATTSQIMDHASNLAASVMAEVQESARAVGIEVGQTHAQTLLDNTRKMVPYDSSMRLDYLASRQMELEYIFARPISAAKKAGYVPSQVVMLHEQLCFLQSNRQESSKPSPS